MVNLNLELWHKSEQQAIKGEEFIYKYLKENHFNSVLDKYKILKLSWRAGCIGFSYGKLFPDIRSILNIFLKKDFKPAESGSNAHIISLSYPLHKIRDFNPLCPRLHIDFLPLKKQGSDVWIVPHIDPHDPEIDDLKHKMDIIHGIFLPPSPELKEILKRIIKRKRITKSLLYLVCSFNYF